MRLNNIKLAGFKSFVDPTTIPFNKDLVAVVGPNGCGKSNVVDAIRWVMGEASAKNLRGESMADVIFNGSSTRKPVGQASVQLSFDNSDGTIGGEYAQYNEIAIKRVASRDGTSNYFLNNVKCRRKDITELFLGTGVGARSYSLIEQGMISRFIEAKPEELRVYLEEAAGISRYKERRRETETRIRHSRENLERVEDLRQEIGTQLEKLQRQSKAAERYKVLKEEERLNKAQLLAMQWRALDHELQSFSDIIKQAELTIEERVTEQRHLGAQIEKQRETQIDLSDELNGVQGQYYGLGAQIAKVEQSIAHYQERYQQLQADNERLQLSVRELRQSVEMDQEQRAQVCEELVTLEPQFVEARAAHEHAAALFEEIEQQLNAWHQQWNDFNTDSSKTLQTAEVEQTRIRHIERSITDINQRIEKLQQEQAAFDYQALQAIAEEGALIEQTILEQREQTQDTLQNVNQQMTQQRAEQDQVNQKLDAVKERMQTAKGQQASLLALQQAALGQQDADMTQWLEKNALHDKPRLAEQLQVDAGWENAVETVLGPHLEAICVNDFAALETLLANTPNGQVEFLKMGEQASVPAGSLAHKVSGQNSAQVLLSSVYCADSLSAAYARLATLSANESVITPDGLWLSKYWLRVAKETNESTGVIVRERQLQTLKQEIVTLETQLITLQENVQANRQQLLELETQRDTTQRQLNQVNQELAQAQANSQMQKHAFEQRRQRAEHALHEMQAQQQALAEQKDELQMARETWQQAIAESEQFANRRVELSEQGEQYRAKLNQVREQVRQDAAQKHQLELRIEQLKPQTRSLEDSIARTEKQLQVLVARSEEIAEQLAQGDEPITERQEELENLLTQRLTVEAKLNEVRSRADTANHHLRSLEDAKDDVAQHIENDRRNLEQYRLDGRTLDVRKNTYFEQLTELDYQLKDVLEALPLEATIAEWQTEAEQIVNRIQRLGPINLAAIEEYKTEQERKEYLDAQCADLMEALATLESAIHKIDRETRAKFKETFDKVNEGFQQLFPRIFGGGSAHLELLGDDLLDTGIAVMAQPPGKRNSTIHLLSGGEKALTAVSLVFAIFQLNPAPFCLLDEVDAPLDDNNAARFCQLVKEMSAKVQFIFITHNKLVMEMAEQLTGVTMHEPGVSRIVAVDVEEAVKLAAA